MIQPGPTYSYENEARFRADEAARDLRTVKTDVAVGSFLIRQESNGAIYRIEVVGGALTATLVTP